jgi:hypothetical protein
MFLISASLAQALLFRTWNEPVSKRFQALLVVLVVGLAFEYLRQYGTFQQRVALIMGGCDCKRCLAHLRAVALAST